MSAVSAGTGDEKEGQREATLAQDKEVFLCLYVYDIELSTDLH